MIAVAAGVKVLVATKPVDFRKGADGLVALVREALGHDPFSETIFIFRSKRADRLKILAWDGSGSVLETAGAGRLQVAAGERRRDAADGTAGCGAR
jgi:transposase